MWKTPLLAVINSKNSIKLWTELDVLVHACSTYMWIIFHLNKFFDHLLACSVPISHDTAYDSFHCECALWIIQMRIKENNVRLELFICCFSVFVATMFCFDVFFFGWVWVWVREGRINNFGGIFCSSRKRCFDATIETRANPKRCLVFEFDFTFRSLCVASTCFNWVLWLYWHNHWSWLSILYILYNNY